MNNHKCYSMFYPNQNNMPVLCGNRKHKKITGNHITIFMCKSYKRFTLFMKTINFSL